MSVRGALPTTSNGPTATDQLRTNACTRLGQLPSDNPAGGVGLADVRSGR
jgi:hypothetical protein